MNTRIRQIRQTQKLTQQDFADSLDVLISTISKYERGKVRPTTEFFNKLVEQYSVNLNWLVTGNGPMYMASESDLKPLQIRIEKAFNLNEDEADLLIDELMQSQMTRNAVIKLLRAKRGNQAALDEVKGILQDIEMVLKTTQQPTI